MCKTRISPLLKKRDYRSQIAQPGSLALPCGGTLLLVSTFVLVLFQHLERKFHSPASTHHSGGPNSNLNNLAFSQVIYSGQNNHKNHIKVNASFMIIDTSRQKFKICLFFPKDSFSSLLGCIFNIYING